MPKKKQSGKTFRDFHPDLADAVEDLLQARKSLDSLTASLAVFVSRMNDEVIEQETAPSEESPYINAKQVAEFLGCSKAVVYNLTMKRSIPFCKFGKSVRYIKDDIMEWAKQEGNYEPKGA